MHVNAKKTAFSGLMLALCVICIVLSGVLEFNTLFLLAVAAFSVGIIVRESGLKYGVAYLVAAVILGFVMAPNKLYCITFAAMGLYILLDEVIWIWVQKFTTKVKINSRICIWAGKYLVFNIMYIPILIFFPKLLFAGELSRTFMLTAFFAGQAILFIYDKAYDYFQTNIWSKYRKFLDVR